MRITLQIICISLVITKYILCNYICTDYSSEVYYFVLLLFQRYVYSFYINYFSMVRLIVVAVVGVRFEQSVGVHAVFYGYFLFFFNFSSKHTTGNVTRQTLTHQLNKTPRTTSTGIKGLQVLHIMMLKASLRPLAQVCLKQPLRNRTSKVN